MPSPIAHSTMGYVIYKLYSRPGQAKSSRFRLVPRLLLTAVGLSLLPDLDSAAGILLNDFGRYHNNGSHSLVVGLGVALVVGGLAGYRKWERFVYWSGFVFLCYQLHVFMDFLTVGRGVMLFWPFSEARFASPVKLFYGLHWSEGFVSHHHFWTLLNEVGIAAVLVLAVTFFEQKLANFKANRVAHSLENLPEQR